MITAITTETENKFMSSTPPQNTKTIELYLSLEQEESITEASKVSGMTKDEIAKAALRNLLKEIKTGGTGHIHATIP